MITPSTAESKTVESTGKCTGNQPEAKQKYGNYIYIYIYHIGYHMRGEVVSVLSLERRYHILSRVSAANEGQNMIS